MKSAVSDKHILVKEKEGFNPFRLISNEDYNKNLNTIIAYFQISKGETKKRFVGQSESWNDQELIAS